MCMGSEFRSTYNFAKIGALFIIDERDRICIEKIKIPIFDGRFSEPGGWISSHHVSSCLIMQRAASHLCIGRDILVGPVCSKDGQLWLDVDWRFSYS